MISVQSMINCTQSYTNSCWVITTEENRIAGVLKSSPYETLEERLRNALAGHYDEKTELREIKELTDELHEVTVYVQTDIEDGYTEILTLTPAWEY